MEIKLSATLRDEHVSVMKRIIKDFKGAKGYLLSFDAGETQIAENIQMLPLKKLTGSLTSATI
jgi:hypothetical protein